LWLRRSLEAAEKMAAEGISAEVVDLRTIVPLDVDTIVASVTKTGRLLVVDEAHSMCGVGAEIAATIMEHAFDELDAPVGRLHIPPVSQPFSPALEDSIVATADSIVAAAKSVLDGRAPIQVRAIGWRKPVESRCPVAGEEQVVKPADVPDMPATAGRTATPSMVANGIPILMPNMDLIITEATVVGWLKKIGDKVQLGETLLEVETDKATANVGSPADGILIEILAEAGEVVPLGQRIGTIQPN
jgi:2-oxoisovalerate dehydrogenase E1 component